MRDKRHSLVLQLERVPGLKMSATAAKSDQIRGHFAALHESVFGPDMPIALSDVRYWE